VCVCVGVGGSGLSSHSPDLFEASLLLLAAAMMAVEGVCNYTDKRAQREREGDAVARRKDMPKGSINVQWRRYLCGSQLESPWSGGHGQNIFSQIPSRRLAASFASGKRRQRGGLRDDRNSERGRGRGRDRDRGYIHVCWAQASEDGGTGDDGCWAARCCQTRTDQTKPNGSTNFVYRDTTRTGRLVRQTLLKSLPYDYAS